jgi:protein-S-isoprenylcysteine O-methyltransferase Ste14
MLRKCFTLTIQLAPMLLLLLAGWGRDDWREFFGNPARTGLIAVIVLGAGTVLLLRLDLHPLRRGTWEAGHQSVVLLMLALASFFLIWFLPFADRRQILTFSNQFLRYVGLGLCIVGIAVRLIALAKLGRYFSAYVTLQDNHQLVQSGIYETIRHPLYLSLLLAGPGFALVFASFLSLPILAMAAAFAGMRIREEDRLLESRFGGEFREYRRRVAALLPGVL